MTPAKRRPATPASQGPTRTAPDVPIMAASEPAPPAETNDGAQLLGAEGEPLAQDSPPTETGQPNPDDPAPQSRRRPGGLYPLPVWPD